jgi:hypothetical protein
MHSSFVNKTVPEVSAHNGLVDFWFTNHCSSDNINCPIAPCHPEYFLRSDQNNPTLPRPSIPSEQTTPTTQEKPLISQSHAEPQRKPH